MVQMKYVSGRMRPALWIALLILVVLGVSSILVAWNHNIWSLDYLSYILDTRRDAGELSKVPKEHVRAHV